MEQWRTGEYLTGRGAAKCLRAFGTGANGAQVVVAENSGGVAVGEMNLDGVVPYLGGLLSASFGLEHGKNGGRSGREGGKSFLFGSLVVASGTGAIVAQIRKVEMAGVAVAPGDIDTGAGLDVNLDLSGLFALIDGSGHEFSGTFVRVSVQVQSFL